MIPEEVRKELEESVLYFEQILHVLPADRTALEFLCVACEQLGESAKYLRYAVALADVLLAEKDAEAATKLADNLEKYDDERAKKAVLKLRVIAAPLPELTIESHAVECLSARPETASRAELALLRRLVDEGVLDEGLVKIAFEQLSNVSVGQGDFLISALLILEKENLKGAIEASVAVADAAHAPPISLDAFEIPLALLQRLPEDLVRVRGVVPFARLGDEFAVALLNPLDEDLKREISTVMNAKCHFFLASPVTIESVMARLSRAMDEAREAQVETAISVESTPPVAKTIIR